MNEQDLNSLSRKFPISESTRRRNQDRSEVSNPKQRELPAQLGSDNAGETQSTGCVPVCFTLYRVRLLDVDAKYASIKDLLDCVAGAGLVAGDKEGQVDLQVRQVKVRTKAEERTEITVDDEPTKI